MATGQIRPLFLSWTSNIYRDFKHSTRRISKEVFDQKGKMHVHAQPVLLILMGLLAWIRWKELGLESANPLVSLELHSHAVRRLSSGPGFSAELGSCFSIGISIDVGVGVGISSYVFPPGLDTTQATGEAAGCWKNNLHSQCCKSDFWNPASPGLLTESFIQQHHSCGDKSKDHGPEALVSRQCKQPTLWRRRLSGEIPQAAFVVEDQHLQPC